MVSYHKTGDGSWTRCRATKRRGAGVSLCPLEVIGVRSEHRNGLEGIAASGGGVLRRWVAEDTYRETRITPSGDGTFEAATGKRKRIFRMDGTLVSLKERVKSEKIITVNDDRPDWLKASEEREDHYRIMRDMGDEPLRALRFMVTEYGVKSDVLKLYLSEVSPQVVEYQGESIDYFADYYWNDRMVYDDFMWEAEEARGYLKQMWRDLVDVTLMSDYEENREDYDTWPNVSEAADEMIDMLIEIHRPKFDRWYQDGSGGWKKK